MPLTTIKSSNIKDAEVKNVDISPTAAIDGNKDTGLDDINKKVIDDNIEPEPRSGRQEYLENILNKYL